MYSEVERLEVRLLYIYFRSYYGAKGVESDFAADRTLLLLAVNLALCERAFLGMLLRETFQILAHCLGLKYI